MYNICVLIIYFITETQCPKKQLKGEQIYSGSQFRKFPFHIQRFKHRKALQGKAAQGKQKGRGEPGRVMHSSRSHCIS